MFRWTAGTASAGARELTWVICVIGNESLAKMATPRIGRGSQQQREPDVTAYYVHIDVRTPTGAIAWFDGVVEAPNRHAAALRAEERAGSVATSMGKYSTSCQRLSDSRYPDTRFDIPIPDLISRYPI